KSENGVLVAAVFALSIGAAMTLAGTRVQQGALTIGDFIPHPKLPCKRARHTPEIIAADCHPSISWYTLNTHHS
ncbi:MAG: hypothetical protein MJE68_20225, partial [Proteobacteria bacterium]|nr:hypothetical protein [Pseudomonadota bacterium]